MDMLISIFFIFAYLTYCIFMLLIFKNFCFNLKRAVDPFNRFQSKYADLLLFFSVLFFFIFCFFFDFQAHCLTEEELIQNEIRNKFNQSTDSSYDNKKLIKSFLKNDKNLQTDCNSKIFKEIVDEQVVCSKKFVESFESFLKNLQNFSNGSLISQQFVSEMLLGFNLETGRVLGVSKDINILIGKNPNILTQEMTNLFNISHEKLKRVGPSIFSEWEHPPYPAKFDGFKTPTLSDYSEWEKFTNFSLGSKISGISGSNMSGSNMSENMFESNMSENMFESNMSENMSGSGCDLMSIGSEDCLYRDSDMSSVGSSFVESESESDSSF